VIIKYCRLLSILFLLGVVPGGAVQAVGLSGVVKDSLTLSPLKGVVVRLPLRGVAATTDNSGAFSFDFSSKTIEADLRPVPFSMTQRNGMLAMIVDKNRRIKITAYSLSGKVLASVNGNPAKGAYMIPSPVRPSGVYLYRAQMDGQSVMVKAARIDDGRTCGMAWGASLLRTDIRQHPHLDKIELASSYQDSLVCDGDGYYKKKVPLPAGGTGLTVLMRPVSLSGGVRPGIWSLGSSQGLKAYIFVDQTGTKVDSARFYVTMNCISSAAEFLYTARTSSVIPKNGFVAIGDSIRLHFFDTSMTASFSTKNTVSMTTSDTCTWTESFRTDSGTVLRGMTHTNHTFALKSVALFSSVYYYLSVNAQNGKVIPTPNKPFFLPDETVELSPVPDSLYRFSGWSGPIVPDTGSRARIVINCSKSVSATFVKNFVLATSVQGGSIVRFPQKPSYSPGDTVRAVVVAESGMCCAKWSGDTLKTSRDTAWVVMNSDKSISAMLRTAPTITINVHNGRVLKVPEYPSYSLGDTVRLIAQPDRNFCCAMWLGDTLRTSADTAWVVIDTAPAVMCIFKEHFILTVIAGHGRVIKVPDKPYYEPDPVDTVRLFPIADSGYIFTGWNTPEIRNSGDTAFVVMTSSQICTASFVPTHISMKFQAEEPDVWQARFAPDGAKVALITESRVSAFDGGGKKLWASPGVVATAGCVLRVSHDGKTIMASNGGGGTFVLYDAKTGEAVREVGTGFPRIKAISFSRDDSKLLFGYNDNFILLVDVVTGTKVWENYGHMTALDISPDGLNFVKCANENNDSSFQIRSMQTGDVVKTFAVGCPYVMNAVYSADGRSVWVVSWNGPVKQIDIASGNILTTSAVTWGQELAVFSPDRSKVATFNRSIGIGLWNTVGEKKTQTCLGSDWANSLEFSPDGKRLLAGTDRGTAIIWDVQ
jgi:WD40 repeat protein